MQTRGIAETGTPSEEKEDGHAPEAVRARDERTTVKAVNWDWGKGEEEENREREKVDVFLTTEEGTSSKEMEKITVFREAATDRDNSGAQVFAVPVKRPLTESAKVESESPTSSKL